MSSQIFAFQVARPLDAAPEEQGSREAHYDPQTQSMLWQGQTSAQAVIFHVCTAHHNAYWNCSSDGTYCTAGGPIRITGGYVCDNIT